MSDHAKKADGVSAVASNELLALRKAFDDQWERERGSRPDEIENMINWLSARNEAAKWYIRGFKEANAAGQTPAAKTGKDG